MKHTMMIRVAALIAVVQLAFAERLQSQACGSATDSAAVHLRARIRRLSASIGATESDERRDLKLPNVDSTTIIAVTQNATCQKALAAFNGTLSGVSPLPAKIYLVKVGTVFVAMYPVSNTYDWPAAVIDSKYKILAKFVL